MGGEYGLYGRVNGNLKRAHAKGHLPGPLLPAPRPCDKPMLTPTSARGPPALAGSCPQHQPWDAVPVPISSSDVSRRARVSVGQGHAEVTLTIWLEYLDCIPTYAINVEGK